MRSAQYICAKKISSRDPSEGSQGSQLLIGKLGVIEKTYVPISWGLRASVHYVRRYLAGAIVDGI